MESSSDGGGNTQKPLSSKIRAPPPPKNVMTCNPEDVKISESDIPNTFSSSHRRGLLKQSLENAKEPQALTMKKLTDGTGLDNEADITGTVSQKANENIKPLTRSDEKMLKTFYGMFYINENSGKDWKLQVDGFIPVCLLQSLGNINKPFKIVAMRGSVRIMEFQVTATTKSTRTKVFVKWNDSQEIMYGARFGKEDQAEQFHSTIGRMVSTLSKTAQLLRQPERKMVLRKMSDPENSSSSTLRRMKVSLLIKLPDKQTTVMSVPGLLTMSELFELICKKETLDPACHQLSLPRVGTRKMTFDSETAVGSLKIREVCIVNVGTAVDGTSGDTGSGEREIVNLVDVQGDETNILDIYLPGKTKKSFRVPLDMSMKILVGRICSQENLNPRFHSLQYLDFKHDFLDMSSTVKDIDSTQLRLMDKRGRNIYTRKSLPDDISLTLTHNHSDMSRHAMGNDKQRQSSVDELDASSAFAVAEADVNPKRFSTPSLLENLPAEFPGHEQNGGSRVHKPAVPYVSNGTAAATQRRNSSEVLVKTRVPPPRPLPYASRAARPPRSQEDTVITSRGLVQDKTLSPIAANMKTTRYASSPNLLANGKENASEASARQIRTSTPDKRRRVAPPPPKPPRTADSEAPSQTAIPPSHTVTVKPNIKKRPAPPRPSRPPPVTRRSSASEASEAAERARKGLDPDAARAESRKCRTPMFIAPPPPSDLPPPIDECETPVGPLTDEDLFYGRSSSSRNGSFLNGSSVDEGSGSLLPSVYLERSTNSQDCDVFLESPLKGTTRTRRNELPVQDEGPPCPGIEADVLPMVPPPVQFSESPDNSRVGTPDIDGSMTPPLEPHEVEVPQRISAIAMQVEEIAPEPVEIKAGEVEQRAPDYKDRDSDNQEIPGEITIVPPPPPPSHSDEKMKQTEEPDAGSSMDHVNAIPPPDGFGTSPGEWKQMPPKPLKKLRINEALFPWMQEPLPPMNAAIPVAVVELEPGFKQKATEELPPPAEFESVAQLEVTPGPSGAHLSDPPASECAVHPEMTSKLHKEVTPVITPDVSAVPTPHVQLQADVRPEVDRSVPQDAASHPPEVILDLRVHTELQRPEGKAGDVQEVALEKVTAAAVKPPKIKPNVPAKSRNKPTPEPYQAVPPDVVSQTDTEALTVLVLEEEARSETDRLLRSEPPPAKKNTKQDEEPSREVEPEVVFCEVKPDVESTQIMERLVELKDNTEPESVEVEQLYQVQFTQVAEEPGELDVISEAPVVAETSSSGLESLNQLEDRFKDIEKDFAETTDILSKDSGAGKSTYVVENPSSYDPFAQPLLEEEFKELEEEEKGICSVTVQSQPADLPSPPSCSPPREIPNSSSLPSPLTSPRGEETQRAQAVEPACPKAELLNPQHTIENDSSTVVSTKDPSAAQGSSTMRSHCPTEKPRRPLSVPPDLLNFGQVKGATEPSKEHSTALRSSVTTEVERPGSLSSVNDSKRDIMRPPPPRGYSSRVGTASFITSAAKKETKTPSQETPSQDTKTPSQETSSQETKTPNQETKTLSQTPSQDTSSQEIKIPSQETKTPSQETVPRQEKKPRPPVPLKRPHSWVGPDVAKKPSSLLSSSAYKPGGSLFQTAEGRKKEFKPVAFSVKSLSAQPNAEVSVNREGEKISSGKEKQVDVPSPPGKEKELDVTKPVVVSGKNQELDLTKPAVMSWKEKALDVTKTVVVSEREKMEAKPDVTSNGKIEGMKVGTEQTIPPAERKAEGKRPGKVGLINTFSSPVEDGKPSATKIDNQNAEGSGKEEPKSIFVNPSRGKYAVLFPSQEHQTKIPETARVGNMSHSRQGGAESKQEPCNKDSKQGLPSLSGRQKYNVLFCGSGEAAVKPAEDASANSPNQPASKKWSEKPAQEEKPHSSLVAGKTFEIIFADDEASKSKPESTAKEWNHSSERAAAKAETKADARGGSVAAVEAGKNKVPGFKPVTKSEFSAPVSLKPVTKNESSREVDEEKKKVPPMVGTKPVGTSLKRAEVSSQQQPTKRQPVPMSMPPKSAGSVKGFKFKMMAKDSSRDTDIVPRGLVASLKARAAQEESETDASELNNNTA